MVDVQVGAAYYFLCCMTERRAMCSRVARVPSCWDRRVLRCGTEKPTSNSSSLALGPNAEHSSREGEDTVHTPTSRLDVARECSAMCGGSIAVAEMARIGQTGTDSTLSNFVSIGRSFCDS
jgi:hypothetical protein